MNRIEEINKEMQCLQNEMDIITEERETYQVNLISLKKSLSKGVLPTHHYEKIQEARESYKTSINEKLKDYRKLKSKKQELSDEKQLLLYSNNTNDDVKNELIKLKDKYFEFYKDKTRISYMRKMASDFIIDLDKVIKNNC